MSRAKWTAQYKELTKSTKGKTQTAVTRSKGISYYEGLLIRLKVSYTIERTNNKISRAIIHTEDGKFDSGLECYCYYRMKEENINFDFQIKYILQKSIKINKENQYIENGRVCRTLKAITLTIDFVTYKNDTIYIIDTKGFQTKQSRLSFKMLEYKFLSEGKLYKILLPKNQSEVEEVIQLLIS